VELTYSFTVRDIPSGADTVSAWVPVPPSNERQCVEGLKVVSGSRHQVVEDDEYGNRFLHFHLTPDERGEAEVTVKYRVTRRAYDALGAENLETRTKAPLSRFLEPDRLVQTDGVVAEEARRVAGRAASALERARLLYDHVVDTMSYDKSGEGWGRGDALYACDVRRGNCTDFHSLFIGEARSLAIPARFVMGVPLPPGELEGEIAGYHCWTEFHIDGKGWVPVDASEASKDKSRRDDLFGGLDADRVEFTLGRDIALPGAEAGPLNYVIYPHVETDGRVHEGVDLTLSFRDA
jgi:transglutaminase-like putative cysteine protease